MDTKSEETDFSKSYVESMRRGIEKRRQELFPKDWRNAHALMPLKSRQQEKSFQFVVEWYEEFDEVVGRERERSRLDRLIEKGEEVNKPKV
ncbi:MAG: hypothetical protein LBU79_01470 [Planctomycetota bacterium]|jgi:hypothetical protein|nr:hypothetical protein [Planctomycetota bacterium]